MINSPARANYKASRNYMCVLTQTDKLAHTEQLVGEELDYQRLAQVEHESRQFLFGTG